MADGNEALSHNDMWDDSLLVDSWNQALEEYKKYHSIHTKGIPPDEIASETHAEPEPEAQADQVAEGAFVAEPETASRGVCADGVSERLGPSDRGASGPAVMLAPHSLLGSVQDEGLKRLLMSWYYAGYYTGLYEGEQKGKASAT